MNSFHLLQFNAHSLNKKYEEINHALDEKCIDICSINETWLKDDSKTDFHKDYDVFLRNRQWRNGGGVAILAKKTLCGAEVHIPSTN